MTRAALYLRLSASDDASTSIERQKADLHLRAEREGWEVTSVLIDDGLSGGKTRANAEAALDLIRTGAADVLLVWKFDRWSRQGLPALAALIDVLDARPEALFVADRDGLASSQPAWRIIASVLAEVARMERENTRARVLSSLAHLRTSGRYAGGQRPYGYVSAPNPDGPGRILVVEPSERDVVREAARRVLAGETPYAISHDLNARGIPSKQGKRWNATVLRTLLQADSLVGRVTHRGELVRDPEGLPVAVWEPLLDLEVWHRVRAHLARPEPAESLTRRRRHARLLSGVLRCASCDAPLYVRHDGKGVVSYVCIQKTDGRECVGVSVNARRIEEHVERLFLDEVGDRPVFDRIEVPGVAATDLAEIEQAIKATTTALVDDDADVEALMGRLAALKARRADLRSASTETTFDLVPTGETFAEAWARSEEPERREMLAANVAILTVSKGRRGFHGLDASRVVFLTQPAYAAEAAVEPPRRGRVIA